jgi:hypothetical protein
MHVSLQSEFVSTKCREDTFMFTFQHSKRRKIAYSIFWCLFQCSGLATLGIDVSLVSTSGVKTKNKEGM